LHYFRSVIAHRDDRVGPVLRGMLQKQLISIFARLLAKIRKYRDIAADNGLQSGARFPITLRDLTMIPRTMP
jgi:hypothetical protein